MHPIERLRFVARANGVEDSLLAIEATAALMAFAGQPPALVAGCRRVLARQLLCGPLWWACARLLTAEDVWAVAQDTITELEDDPTAAALAYSLGASVADEDPGGTRPRVLRARVMGRSEVVAEPITDELGGLAGFVDDDVVPAWLVVPVGVHLSDPMWDALKENLRRSNPERAPELLQLSDFSHFVGPYGLLPMVALDGPDCPVAAELFRLEG